MWLKLIPLYARRSESRAKQGDKPRFLLPPVGAFWMSLRQALFLAFGFGSERVIIMGFLHVTGLISAGKLVYILAHWIHVHTGSSVGPMFSFSSLWLGHFLGDDSHFQHKALSWSLCLIVGIDAS